MQKSMRIPAWYVTGGLRLHLAVLGSMLLHVALLYLGALFLSTPPTISPQDKTHLVQEQGGYVNNVLNFCKHARVPGKINEAIHKFFTKFVPPIIPVAGGVIIDFVHLYEMVQAWRNPDEGQMRRYRLEALEEHLRYTRSNGVLPEPRP